MIKTTLSKGRNEEIKSFINRNDVLFKNSILGIAMRNVVEQQALTTNNSNNKARREVNSRINDFLREDKIEEVLGEEIIRIASRTGANCVVVIEKVGSEKNDMDELMLKTRVSVFRKEIGKGFSNYEYETLIKPALVTTTTPVKEVLIKGIKKKLIKKNDRVVCVEKNFGNGFKAVIYLFDVNELFFDISYYKLSDIIRPEVLEAVINIALEIGREGREGKHVGTGFIIGDREEIMKFTKQMILNPFNGYPENLRNIVDPELKETIKNFAQLDGVFIINKDGTVISAGTYLDVDTNQKEIKSLTGFGTRHRCAAAITKQTKSIAIVVSESGGKVRIFKNGKVITTLV